MKSSAHALFLLALALAPLTVFAQSASSNHHEPRQLMAKFRAQDHHAAAAAQQRNHPVTSGTSVKRTTPANSQRDLYQYLSPRARNINAAASR